jgi:tetratricopeptide repeat protein 30
MTRQNESAEGIMKAVEKEEQQNHNNAKPAYLTYLINLVIGTLYCAKGNYEFGMSYICKSLDPLEKNLCPNLTQKCVFLTLLERYQS